MTMISKHQIPKPEDDAELEACLADGGDQLARNPSQLGVVADWVRVPSEPTEAMIVEGGINFNSNEAEHDAAIHIYRAMISAAPPPPVVSREDVAEIIYDRAFTYDVPPPSVKPKWQAGGNSNKQYEARRIADAILALFQKEG